MESTAPSPAESTIGRLPQELRDEIWKHFLDAEFVRQSPTNKEPSSPANIFRQDSDTHNSAPELSSRPYRFQTVVLRLNKAIHDEAQKLLFKRNAFVLVRYNCPVLRPYLEVFQVPIVSEHALENFANHSFTIEIAWTTGPPGCWNWDINASKSQIQGVLLMLAQDLPKLWNVMQLLCCTLVGTGPAMRSPKDPFRLCHPGERGPTIHIHAHDPEYRTLRPEACERFLAPIRSVMGVGHGFHFHGFEVLPSAFLEQLKRHLAPPVLWLSAIEMGALEVLLKLKKEAESCAIAGQFAAAEAAFAAVLLHKNEFQVSILVSTDDFKDRWQRLGFDLRMSLVWIYLRQGDISRAEKVLPERRRLPETIRPTNPDSFDPTPYHQPNLKASHPTGSEAFHRYQHLELLVNILAFSQRGEQHRPVVWRMYHQIRDLPWKNARAEHDAVVLGPAIGFSPVLDYEDLLRRSSVGSLPFLVFDSQAEVCSPFPDYLVGWQDKRQKSRLSEKLKTGRCKENARRGLLGGSLLELEDQE